MTTSYSAYKQTNSYLVKTGSHTIYDVQVWKTTFRCNTESQKKSIDVPVFGIVRKESITSVITNFWIHKKPFRKLGMST